MKAPFALALWATAASAPAFADVTYTVDTSGLTAGATVSLSSVVKFNVDTETPFALAWFFPEDDATIIAGGAVYGAYDPLTNYTGNSYWFDLKGSYASYNSSGVDFPAYSGGTLTVPPSGKLKVFFQADWIYPGDKAICCVTYSTINLKPLPSLQQILGDSVSVETKGDEISGSFMPKLGLSLAKAAETVSSIIGRTVDHFNWVQEVTAISIPGLGTETLSIENALVEIAARRSVGLDPLIGGNINYWNLLGYKTSDDLPEYWDEYVPDSPGYDESYLISSNTHADLGFFDNPSNFPPGTVIDFSTLLVGVDNNGLPIYFDGIDDIGFKWRFTSGLFNTTECIDTSVLTCLNYSSTGVTVSEDGNTELLSYLSANEYASVVSSVNGNLASSVPEPTTWIMLTIGFLLCGSSMRSRRRKLLIGTRNSTSGPPRVSMSALAPSAITHASIPAEVLSSI